ncbi:MAG: A/G-specific adenine glycosylase [Thiobacillus sp.]|nr:A/G-specific adenine glycosylase [Thiobacillus sp.]
MIIHPAIPATADFAPRLIHWQRGHGRHDLPWQVSDPYTVWVSEIMLQQTQVDTVIPYYARFMARFPDLAGLAAAPEHDVLALWSGLGYYARARNLHAAALKVMAEHGGVFPRDVEAIAALPGIGRSTAAAIAAFSFGERRAILDGNVKRVFCRLFGVDGWPGDKKVENRLWQLAEALLPADGIRPYTQGLMDLGATLCRRSRPDCPRCPFTDDCIAHRDGRQAELPTARPRKALPEKATVMLVLRRAGEILLEKRPPTGIWGGLWSLPECSPDEDPVAAARRLGYAAEPLAELPGLSHTFSHFRLAIQPKALAVAPRQDGAREPGTLWLTPAEARQAALPTPVRRIIDSL